MQTLGGGTGISNRGLFIRVLAAGAFFHLAFLRAEFAFLILLYLGCLLELTKASSNRAAFHSGFALGLVVFIPKLLFFYTLFQISAVALWAILAFWHGLFVLLGGFIRRRFSPGLAVLLIPVVWTGLEYFRSECYYLKFSWLSAGYAFALMPPFFLSILGVYGVGFAGMLAAGFAASFQTRRRLLISIAMVALVFALSMIPPKAGTPGNGVEVAGIQMEFPVELEVPSKLDALIARFPGARLVVLSEYTFDGPIPARVHQWCKKNARYLIVGGKEAASDGKFYNTVFVIGPDGEVVFKQAKVVPIQFFKDGLPAPGQSLWNSPWGRIGICICYDLSYSRVVDELVRQGAQALIVPTMDVVDWGRAQHELHYRVAPIRAAEYQIPVFRLASSGISQFVNQQGMVETTAPFPGEDAFIHANLPVDARPALPLDRNLAPVCAWISGMILLLAFASGWVGKAPRLRPPAPLAVDD